MATNTTLTICTIATRKYIGYLSELLTDLENHLENADQIDLVILTDGLNMQKARLLGEKCRLSVQIFEIEDMAWPEITLFRYDILKRYSQHLSGNYVMWIDADMRLLKNWDFLKTFQRKKGIWFALHPGFRNSLNRYKLFPMQDLKLQLSIILKNFMVGQFAYGTWEGRKNNLAYVPPAFRRHYFHGAIWAGSRNEILQMLSLLSIKASESYRNQSIPIWHDESLLNWYAAMSARIPRKFPRHFSAWRHSVDFSQEKSIFLSVDKNEVDAAR